MNPDTRPSRASSRAGEIATVLFVLSPLLVPALIVLALGVMFFALLIVGAFGQGFAVGCAALAGVIGVPSLGLLWLSAAMRVFGRRRFPVAGVPAAPRPPQRSDSVDRP